MPLRINLSKKPFEEFALKMVLIIVLFVIALSLTAGNMARIVSIRFKLKKGAASIKKMEKEIETSSNNIKKNKDSLSGTWANRILEESNYISDELKMKSFSWITFLERFEKAKPWKISFLSIRPEYKGGFVQVDSKAIAGSDGDLIEFQNNLLTSPYFTNIEIANEGIEQNSKQIVFSISFIYNPSGKS